LQWGALFFVGWGVAQKTRERERERKKKKGKIVAFLWFPCPSPTNFREVTSFSSSFF